jgi:hypothetical protein
MYRSTIILILINGDTIAYDKLERLTFSLIYKQPDIS